ncbi:MAG: glycosyltransferase, partial [Planctomycetota bacterium]
NKPHQLSLVLEGLRHQTSDDYEVIVADDGSTDDTRTLIEEYADSVSFRVHHAWQADDGFRAARVRNLGVKAAEGDRIVFLDGDCVPFPNFLDAHAAGARDDVAFAGDRLFLDREPSAALTCAEVADGSFVERIPKSEFRSLRWRAMKNRVYSATRLKERPKVVTANLSLSRKAFESVNGLDERFVGWGHEDEDLRRRLVRRGTQIASVFTTAQVCHLWHKQVDSFHGKVKFGDNIPYFKRGFYLSRCREGLKPRPLDECVLVWNAESSPTEQADAAMSWGSRPNFVPADVKILICRTQPGENTVTAPPRPSGADLHVVTESDRSGELIAAEADRPPEFHIDRPIDPENPADRARLIEDLEPIL